MKMIKEFIQSMNIGKQENKMVMRQTIEDATAIRKYVPSSIEIEWVSKKLDGEGQPVSQRKPQEENKKYTQKLGFFAAGKAYKNLQQLAVEQIDDFLHKDIYGREVLCFRERFPCFDCYDYLHEDRYFRWFYIREANSLSLVYTEDTFPEIEVTEDTSNIPSKWWEKMQKYWA